MQQDGERGRALAFGKYTMLLDLTSATCFVLLHRQKAALEECLFFFSQESIFKTLKIQERKKCRSRSSKPYQTTRNFAGIEDCAKSGTAGNQPFRHFHAVLSFEEPSRRLVAELRGDAYEGAAGSNVRPAVWRYHEKPSEEPQAGHFLGMLSWTSDRGTTCILTCNLGRRGSLLRS